jgi:hypothetical protein
MDIDSNLRLILSTPDSMATSGWCRYHVRSARRCHGHITSRISRRRHILLANIGQIPYIFPSSVSKNSVLCIDQNYTPQTPVYKPSINSSTNPPKCTSPLSQSASSHPPHSPFQHLQHQAPRLSQPQTLLPTQSATHSRIPRTATQLPANLHRSPTAKSKPIQQSGRECLHHDTRSVANPPSK